MTDRAGDLARLAVLAGMIRDARLADLRDAAQAREASLAALRALDRPPAPSAQVSVVALARANLAYQAWADARRAEINPRLASQTAVWIERRDAAARAFGRAEALARLQERLAAEARRR